MELPEECYKGEYINELAKEIYDLYKNDLKDKIQEIVYDNVRKIDTFNIRDVEYKVSRWMLNNLYMQPDVTN